MKHTLEIEENAAEQPSKNKRWQTAQICFNVLNHLMIIAVTVYMTYVCYNAGYKAISVHAWLCTIGYQLLMTEAILSFYPHNVWSICLSRTTQRRIHLILQIIGAMIALYGSFVNFYDRARKLKEHLISTHSCFGILAAMFTLTTLFNGISALWSTELKNFARPVHFKLVHSSSGVITFLLGMIALFLGYDQSYMVKYSSPNYRILLQVCAVISVVLSVYGATRSIFNHYRNANTNK